ncbi:uncharacterized protein C8Q71DRAFT_861358 [Rhodofomes roseus]|uniref:Uncharacterized protein n=1 Tax=Rhodofomes roseus TaxID=34475 RepID=A0ABQ8K524_9APHY|nr:uncharacterized protein C8Q71DRAFT_861358 [Rhodofomes roseus]KAH9832067.1 hypothetical protein C8Q71DRAFT_861358 [Rhodofomes roseus]
MRDPDVVVPPAGSFRRVQGDHPDWKKKNMDPKQVKAWEELIKGQPYVVVQVAELGTEGPGVNERIDEIMAILLRLSQILGIVIIPSHSVKKPTDDDNTPKPRNKEPVWYLILGLTEKWCAALIRAAWLDSQKISLNFDRWTHDIPTLCAAFRFVYRFGAHSKEEYDAIVRRELLESDIRKVIIEILLADIERGGQWRRSTRDDAFGAILDSVDVDVITVNVTAHLSEPVAFIHIAPPTSDWQDWLRFCAAVSTAASATPWATRRYAARFDTRLAGTTLRSTCYLSRQRTLPAEEEEAAAGVALDEDEELEDAACRTYVDALAYLDHDLAQ